jgi:hypothetical protein
MKARRKNRGIALLFFVNLGTLDEGGWLTPLPCRLYPRERDLVPLVQEAGWAPGPASTSAENLAPTGIRSLDRSARTESLYRLSYRGPRVQLEVLCKSVEVVYGFVALETGTRRIVGKMRPRVRSTRFCFYRLLHGKDSLPVFSLSVLSPQTANSWTALDMIVLLVQPIVPAERNLHMLRCDGK